VAIVPVNAVTRRAATATTAMTGLCFFRNGRQRCQYDGQKSRNAKSKGPTHDHSKQNVCWEGIRSKHALE
jgi:hypothetical protein